MTIDARTKNPAKREGAEASAVANMRRLLGTPDAIASPSGESPSLVANMRKLLRQEG